MTEHTPITGDMRHWWELHVSMTVDADLRDGFGNLCDAIDAVHANLERENARLKAELEEDTKGWLSFDGEIARLRERTERLKAECDEAYHSGWTTGYDEGFADADDVLGVVEEYGVLEEHGWVKLPKDADGVTIHAGDVLDGYGKIIEVVELRYGRSGWVIISRDGNGYADTFAFSHHHAPTVEDVLREFAHVGISIVAKREFKAGEIDLYADEGAIAEYAAKLRLAEGKQEQETDDESHIKANYIRLLRIAGECTSQLREKHGLGYIVMPMGAAQALCETVAEIVGKRYDMTDEGVEFDG